MAEYDENTGTVAQTEFYRDVIKSLLKGSNVNTALMSQPGGWYHSVSDLLGTVAGTALTQKVNKQENELYSKASGFKGAKKAKLAGEADASFMPPSKVGMIDPSGAITGGTGIETASTGQPSSDIYNSFVNEVKKSENSPLFEGKINKSKAEWDYKQHSIGYGTRSKPGEVIDKDEAERRFGDEWGKSEKVVDAFKPGLDPGSRAALTSLTFNAGPGWTQGGLGKAVTAGNMDEAKRIFSKYYMAGGKPNEGLKARRQREAQWFGQGKDDVQTASVSSNAAKDELQKIAAAGMASPDAQMPTQGGPLGVTTASAAPAAAAPTSSAATAAQPAASAIDNAEKQQLAQAAATKGLSGTPPAPPSPTPVASAVAGSEQRVSGNPYQAQRVFANEKGMVNIPGMGWIQAPTLPPLLPREVISARARISKDPEKVLADYEERAQGKDIKLSTGTLHLTPTENGPPEMFFAPNLVTEMGKIAAGATKSGSPTMNLLAPGKIGDDTGDTETVGNRLSSRQAEPDETAAERFTRDRAKIEADAKATGELTTGKVKTVNEAIERGTAAQNTIKVVNTMLAMSKAAGNSIPRGPTSPFMLSLRQFGDNFGIPIPANTGTAEAIKKLNAGLAAQATGTASGNRGGAFVLSTFLHNNPDLMNTKEGMEILLDVIRQEHQGYVDLGKLANGMKGHNVDEFNAKMDDYYKNNPIQFDYTIPGGEKVKVTTKPIRTRDDFDSMESGQHFVILKTGRIGVKP